MDSLVSLKGVSKSYGALTILSGVDFQVGGAETVSIMGPSGIGKSTLLHLAGLMDRPNSGEIFILGKAVQNLPERILAQLRLDVIGFLFQFHYLLPDLTVIENVLLPARLAGDDLKRAEQEATDLLDKMGLSQRLSHRPDQLSGGEQQRVALARALSRSPKILLCDEPTGNLDSHTAHDMMDLILGYVTSRQMAAVLVTHNEQLAQRTQRSYILSDGNLKLMKTGGHQG